MLLTFIFLLAGPQQPAPPRLPLPEAAPFQLWTSSQFPTGINFGEAVGMSLGDWNADGWTDVFAFSSAHLWKNEGGQGWSLIADLDSILPYAAVRYGAAFGDFNADGLPDIATEPRKGQGDSCLHILRNEGGGNFTNIATDPALLNWQPCGAFAETNLWGDVDGDGDLDLFMPTYQVSKGSIDNRFLQNLGPTGPNGEFRFFEDGPGFGVAIPAGASNPEGAQFLDLDHDGDLDLFSNGHLYLNQSTLGIPSFEWLKAGVSGIRKRAVIDEGSVLTDYDLDGDFDLLQNYTAGRGFRIWRNEGDGTFAETPEEIIEDHMAGASFGIGVCDFDLDGDEDFLGLNTIRKNTAAQGRIGFKLIPNPIPPSFTTGGVPGWCDWDRDGDADLFLANGNYGTWLFENTTYDSQTSMAKRRDLRVRAVKADDLVPRGLESEYGTVIELIPRQQTFPARWVRTVTSSGGYINQNEYDVSFAVPGATPSANPIETRFDLMADFPSLPEQGFHRVDSRVNPALANLSLRNLKKQREIRIEREGAVHIRGVRLDPQPPLSPKLATTGFGLIQPSQTVGLPDMQDANSQNWFVGVELSIDPSAEIQEVRELWLDGAPFQRQHGETNVFVWDVTPGQTPVRIPGGSKEIDNLGNNDRQTIPVSWRLLPGHLYRVVARVSRWRSTPIAGPVHQGDFTLHGGLAFDNPFPRLAADTVQASVDAQNISLALRLAEAGPDWRDFGEGSLDLSVEGDPSAGNTIRLSLQGAPPLADVYLVLGHSVACSSYPGGRVLVPNLDQVVPGGQTDATGSFIQDFLLPVDLKQGNPIVLQALVEDSSAPFGRRLTHAMVARVRPVP